MAPQSAPDVAVMPDAGAAQDAGVTQDAGAVAQAPEPSEGPGRSLREFMASRKLRLSLVAMPQLADREREGLLALDLGGVGDRKYTMGGWRSGWKAAPGREGEVGYADPDGRAPRLLFKHTKGGFEAVALRVKGKAGTTLSPHLNDKKLGDAKLSGQWETLRFAVAPEQTAQGENSLTLKMGGRVMVDAAWMLPAGTEPEMAPQGEARGEVTLGGVKRQALVASSPQSYVFRVHVPGPGASLGFAWGSSQPGASFEVWAAKDGSAPERLFEGVSDGEGWREQVVGLSGYEEDTVELTLKVGGAWGETQTAAWGDAGLWSEPLQDQAKPPSAPEVPAQNLVIYLIDTMRYDKFSVYNDKTKVETPNIDAFAKDGVIFEHAYDNENWTKPSTATILTGLYPSTHKTKEDSSKLPTQITMLPEHLKKQGFKTGSFIANGYVSNAFGFDQGWDYYTNYIREYKNTDADRVVADAVKWIDKVKDQRFFAYVHTIDPHVPYSPPEEWRKKYWDKPYRGPIRPQNTGNQLADIKIGDMKLTPTDKEYLEALYNGEVAFNDHEFGRLVEALKERGLYENTAILIVADHGEEFWDHGAVGHGHSLYEELLRPPFFLRFPGKAPSGRRVSNVVQMVDVVPTVYDLLGVPHNEGVEGVSLVSTFDGAGEPRPYMAASEFLSGYRSFRVGRYKWITDGKGGKMYDVVGDRHETKELLKKRPVAMAFVRGMAGLFLGAEDKTAWWSSEGGAAPTVGGQPVAKKVKVEVAPSNAEIDPELRKQLEAMGYVDGAAAPSEKPKKPEPKKK
jgi:arylsulfatase A-like enzyme